MSSNIDSFCLELLESLEAAIADQITTATWCSKIYEHYEDEKVLIAFVDFLNRSYKNGNVYVPDYIYDVLEKEVKKYDEAPSSDIKKKIYLHEPQKLLYFRYYQNDKQYYVTPKLDGATGILKFSKNGVTLTSKDRRNKQSKHDITRNIKHLTCYKSIAKLQKDVTEIDNHWANDLTLYGEIIINNKEIPKTEHASSRAYSTTFVLRQYLTPDDYKLDFVVFCIKTKNKHFNLQTKLTMLREYQFDIVDFLPINLSFESYKQKYWQNIIDSFKIDYSMDGVVVNTETGTAIAAIKITSDMRIVQVTSIEWTLSRNRYVPIVCFDPICINNKTFNKISLSTYKKLVNNHVHIGSRISVVLLGNCTLTYYSTIDSDPNNFDYDIPEHAVVKNEMLVANTMAQFDIYQLKILTKYLVPLFGKTQLQRLFDRLPPIFNLDQLIDAIKQDESKMANTIKPHLYQPLPLVAALAMVPANRAFPLKQTIQLFERQPKIKKAILKKKSDLDKYFYLDTELTEKTRSHLLEISKRLLSWDTQEIVIGP